MGRIVPSNSKEFKGPWLLSREDFDDLEKIISDIDSQLEKSLQEQLTDIVKNENENLTEEQIAVEVAKKKERYPHSSKTNVFFFRDKDNDRLPGATLKALLRDNTFGRFKPKEFYCFIEHGSNKFKLEIGKYTGGLEYELNCYDEKTEDELRDSIQLWVEKRNPSILLQFWSHWGEVLAMYLFIGLIITSLFAFTPEPQSYSDIVSKESREILRQGVNEKNLHKAVELLLKSQSSYVPDEYAPVSKPRDTIYYKIFLLNLFTFFAAAFSPQTIIGIGSNKTKLKYYKHWLKLVIAVLTTILVAPWGKVVSWFWAS